MRVFIKSKIASMLLAAVALSALAASVQAQAPPSRPAPGVGVPAQPPPGVGLPVPPAPGVGVPIQPAPGPGLTVQPAPPQVTPLLQGAPAPPGAAPGAPAQAAPASPPGPPARPQRVRNTPGVSCSDWLQACRRRGGAVAACTEQRDTCIKTTGCFTEEAKFGGETFCQLRRL